MSQVCLHRFFKNCFYKKGVRVIKSASGLVARFQSGATPIRVNAHDSAVISIQCTKSCVAGASKIYVNWEEMKRSEHNAGRNWAWAERLASVSEPVAIHFEEIIETGNEQR
jgi:hypothetical protein